MELTRIHSHTSFHRNLGRGTIKHRVLAGADMIRPCDAEGGDPWIGTERRGCLWWVFPRPTQTLSGL